MNQADSSPTGRKSLLTIAWAGLVAGTLDAIATVVMFLSAGGKSPIRVFQFIASGIFGKDAFVDGSLMAVWGVVIHFTIALMFAAFFFFIYPQIYRFISRPVAIGLLYGLLIWVVMNRIVLPFSNAPALPFDPTKAVIELLVLMILVGLPISLIVHKHYSAS
jgi:uncharacterized membrane protein YagU involved in acid resistance